MSSEQSAPPEPGTVCKWFAMCDRPATVLLPHPILGKVPTCTPCAEKVERLSK